MTDDLLRDDERGFSNAEVGDGGDVVDLLQSRLREARAEFNGAMDAMELHANRAEAAEAKLVRAVEALESIGCAWRPMAPDPICTCNRCLILRDLTGEGEA